MRIVATRRAKQFIEESGGKVYVWSDDSGFDHAGPEPPDLQTRFDRYPADGFTFYQDTTIGSPDWWKIEFHHLPHEHVTATWDGGQFGAGGLNYWPT